MLTKKRHAPVRAAISTSLARSPLEESSDAFVAWTIAVGMSPETARIRRAALHRFIEWSAQQGTRNANEITHELLEKYQGSLSLYRKRDGQLIADGTKAARLNPVIAFCRWLARQGFVDRDPARRLVLPRSPRRLPSRVPTVAEMARILRQPDIHSLSGIRDRAILEMLYASGLRRTELARLRIEDVDLESAVVMVRAGKGRRDRNVPIGARAVEWVRRYLAEVRTYLAEPMSGDTLFVTDYGEPFERNRLGDMVRRHVVGSGFGGRGACHLFRHACATHMLENGADIRYIQSMLGHSQVSTTEIYTRVSVATLRHVYERTHPSAREGTSSRRLRLPFDAAHPWSPPGG
jgi:integrase/recombinase XerD